MFNNHNFVIEIILEVDIEYAVVGDWMSGNRDITERRHSA
jgi:hypothetical protein